MKDFKNDSTSVLTRFGRDKRQRTVTATAERVERRPRLQRDAADSEQPSDDRKPVKRASYIPTLRRTTVLHSTNRAAVSATNGRATAPVRTNVTATATNRAARSAISPAAKNPPTATTGDPRNSATASSATNPTANVNRRQARRRPSVRGQKVRRPQVRRQTL